MERTKWVPPIARQYLLPVTNWLDTRVPELLRPANNASWLELMGDWAAEPTMRKSKLL